MPAEPTSLLKKILAIRAKHGEGTEFVDAARQALYDAQTKGYPTSLLRSICKIEIGQDLDDLLSQCSRNNRSWESEPATPKARRKEEDLGDDFTYTTHFDHEFYLSSNPDILEAGIDPLAHYIHHGWKEGRNPSSQFNVSTYLYNNPDVRRSGIEPLLHYHTAGLKEGRRVQAKLNRSFALPSDVDEKEHCIALPTLLNYPPNATPSKPAGHSHNIGIHLHIHYKEEAPRLLARIASCAPYASLYISCTSREAELAIENEIPQSMARKTQVRIVENRGRDIAPLLIDFTEELQKHDCCLHIHSKKSPEKSQGLGNAWSSHMLQCLLYDAHYTDRLITWLLSCNTTRLLAPCIYEPIREQLNWGANKDQVDSYLNKLGLASAPERCPYFPAGSFFWFKPELLTDLARLNLHRDSFPEEPIPDDGTPAHAIERLIGCIETVSRGHVLHSRPLDTHSKISASPPAISIIIPSLNAVPWIYDCISSCLCQDFILPYEVVIVDNGSDDGSAEAAESYEAAYPERVRFIREETAGAGNARNAGIKASKAPYITFVDADDILPHHALQVLWEAMSSSPDADFIAASLAMFSETSIGRAIPYGQTGEACILQLENEAVANSNIWKTLLSDFGPCAKLYRADFLKRHKILFPTSVNYEDNLFICCVYALAEKASTISTITYLYRKYKGREGLTQSTSLSSKAISDQIEVLRSTAQCLIPLCRTDTPTNVRVASILRSLRRKTEELIRGTRRSPSEFHPTLSAIDEQIAQAFSHYTSSQY